MSDKIIRLEITDSQYQALSKKKLADVIALYDAVNSLTAEHPDKASLLNKFLSNETVDIIYHGGSTPGAKRRVVLQKINANGTFSAFCIESDASKSFKIEKAELKEK
ncbi:hypothetical protein H5185_08670 [Shewanella sp. SG44-6]|uniref:hypothetical protein n=1 Tax=Shewanella sp. SG44-6 TaxID=2760959 RepID=UPI00160396B3|nr:hypothetical protein [Shewanella sp. SG44-6]MBB1389494.1 hypothetical protein [Shewanella sp. SG44-6]